MAAKTANKVTLLGYLSKKPELVVLPRKNGGEVKKVTVRLATNESYPDGEGGFHTDTDWHNLVFWNKSAEAIAKIGNTKTPLYVEGVLKNRSYKKNEQTFYVTEVRVDSFIVVGGSSNDGNDAQNNNTPMADPYSESVPQNQQEGIDPYEGVRQPKIVETTDENTQDLGEPPY